MRADGPQLVDQAAAEATRTLHGDLLAPDVTADDAATREVDELVARLASAATGDVAGELAALAVADVVVPPAARRPRRRRAAGRRRAARGAGEPAGLDRRARARDAERHGHALAGAGDRRRGDGRRPDRRPRVGPDPAGHVRRRRPRRARPWPWRRRTAAVDTVVPAGDPDRLLVLAERADPHWHASLDGRSLRSVDGGWRQTFDLGADAGELVVRYDDPDRGLWLALQGLVALVTILLAVPVRRRRGVRT